MNNVQKVTEIIAQQGMLPLYFNEDENVSIQVLRALYRAGIKAVEYTSRGDTALSNFKKMIQVRDSEMPDLLIGIGTIKNLKQAQDYFNAGADFFISPGFITDVALFLKNKSVFYSPGCMTPTEIITAENTGIKFIKLFPGNSLGSNFLKGIKDIFPNLFFMATGGVDTTNDGLTKWFEAGVCAVGLGSNLISKQLMNDKEYTTIESDTRAILDKIRLIKISIYGLQI
ncbi:bifunctional 4-hydroxy-2-oxoglutarate aldolase/2-dehydro-3-deoxy-phosphogluconate aldolase [Flavobacterium sp.]|uniref:bifunctional 4-hydroxy-2-oxoglutarate aldolase/2-dehydro-3-deoxy-phosphogluconate aldolase n=1 Tax=Flavobacterium sp. TaxID=239 RepID=UPI00286C3A2A|nr:bifunctional 4-hydroxy-2-oxoglutarate aldolase/2-dehydro-3-deoxy-phosphogluconate aldolase [Flavobacterium sp.]